MISLPNVHYAFLHVNNLGKKIFVGYFCSGLRFVCCFWRLLNDKA